MPVRQHWASACSSPKRYWCRAGSALIKPDIITVSPVDSLQVEVFQRPGAQDCLEPPFGCLHAPLQFLEHLVDQRIDRLTSFLRQGRQYALLLWCEFDSV